ADVYGMDVARYGIWAENKQYIKQTTGQFYSRRFVMTYPNEQLPAGRPLKMTGVYSDMDAKGAVWGQSWDLEVPLYFAPKGFVETPSLKRSNAHDIVGAECRAVRAHVGLLDITAFSRFEVTGPNAAAWLDRMMASKLPAAGRVKLAPMLGHDGRMKGDLTLFNWGDGRWWITGSYYLRQWHMRWFNDHLEDGVSVRDLGDEMAGMSLAGPKAREVLRAALSDGDADALRFMGCAQMDVGLVRCHVGRLSVARELGYELHCRAGDLKALRDGLLAAGGGHGMVEYGFNALLSLRLEKSFGIWSAEFTQGYTPGMTGMDRWIDWSKDFIGKAAARKERDAGTPDKLLVTLEIDAVDADASGYEPVWKR
ncbi:MAG: glycine cleavage system protein T, partial [Sulfitobacter sp.]|nr:glycine cleavage system protein T [Sulfitobacter sp.]